MKGKFFLFSLAALAAGFLIVASYRDNGVKTYPSYKTSSMSDFRLTHKEHDQVKWELVAEKATFPQDEKKVFLKALTMTVHQDRSLSLLGGSGVYNIPGKTLVIHEPIEIDIEGAKLTTSSLTWNGKNGMLTTADRIRFEDKNFLIEGKGLTAEVKNRKIRVLNNVKGVFYY